MRASKSLRTVRRISLSVGGGGQQRVLDNHSRISGPGHCARRPGRIVPETNQ